MGISYFICDSCQDTYADCDEDGCYCDSCTSKFCRKECGKLSNYKHDFYEGCDDETGDDDEAMEDHRIDKSLPITCVLCRKEKCTDEILLKWMLKHFNLTKANAQKLWKKEK